MFKIVFLSLSFFYLPVLNFQRNASENLPKEKKSLKVMITKKNHYYYYYENELATDGANFKTGNSKTVMDMSRIVIAQHGSDNMLFLLKIENNDSLNSESKKLVDHIKKQKHYQVSSLNEVEKALISVTEQFIGDQ